MDSGDPKTESGSSKSNVQRIVEVGAWIIVFTMGVLAAVSGFSSFQHGYWFPFAIAVVLLTLSLPGLVCRWGIVIPATVAGIGRQEGTAVRLVARVLRPE